MFKIVKKCINMFNQYTRFIINLMFACYLENNFHVKS